MLATLSARLMKSWWFPVKRDATRQSSSMSPKLLSRDRRRRNLPSNSQWPATPNSIPSTSASPQCRMGNEKQWGIRLGLHSVSLAEPCKARDVEVQPEPVESISAITLLTVDMEESVAFYHALGFHRLYGGAEESFTSFRVGGGYLNLQLATGESPPRVIWGRVVLWVDDVDAMYERALTAGFDPDTSPADAPWGERYFHIHDPDGHELSFARPLKG
jgi:catechol 2,3-dioxygenase-like lactoylglutathione lyase family enzyme